MLGSDSTSTAVAPSPILLLPPNHLQNLPKMLSELGALLEDLMRYASQPKERRCSGQLDNFFGCRLFDYKEGPGVIWGDIGQVLAPFFCHCRCCLGRNKSFSVG